MSRSARKRFTKRFKADRTQAGVGLPFRGAFVQSPGIEQTVHRFGGVLLDEQDLSARGYADDSHEWHLLDPAEAADPVRNDPVGHFGWEVSFRRYQQDTGR